MSDAMTELSYDDAVEQFLDYLREYRSFSASTVRAYGTDLRKLREFLEKRLGRVVPRKYSSAYVNDRRGGFDCLLLSPVVAVIRSRRAMLRSPRRRTSQVSNLDLGVNGCLCRCCSG